MICGICGGSRDFWDGVRTVEGSCRCFKPWRPSPSKANSAILASRMKKAVAEYVYAKTAGARATEVSIRIEESESAMPPDYPEKVKLTIIQTL